MNLTRVNVKIYKDYWVMRSAVNDIPSLGLMHEYIGCISMNGQINYNYCNDKSGIIAVCMI